MQKPQRFPLISRLIGGSFSHRRRGSVGDSKCKIVRLDHDSKLCIWYTFVIDYPVLHPSIHCPSLFQPQSIPTKFHTSLHCTAPPRPAPQRTSSIHAMTSQCNNSHSLSKRSIPTNQNTAIRHPDGSVPI